MVEKDVDKQVIKEIRALTGFSEGVVRDVFKAFSNIHAIGAYSENKEIHIPYLAKLRLRYEGDEITANKEREAKITSFVGLHDNFIKNVGIIEDWRKGEHSKPLELDGYKFQRANARNTLKLVE